jgi:hypothetical protein
MDRRYTECFGFTLEELYETGAVALEQRLRAIGLRPEQLIGVAFPFDLPPRERGERAVAILAANLVGPKGPVVQTRRVMELMRDNLRRQADPRPVRPGTVIQWDFADAEPFYLTLDGTAAVTAGRAARPDLTLRMRFADWAEVFAGRADPRRLLLRGRLRPRGDLRLLLKLGAVLG